MPKIKIICTKEQAVHFVKSTCPSKFDDEWSDYTKDLKCLKSKSFQNFECDKKCVACWKQYVVFDDGVEKGETALSPILVSDGYADGYPVYEYWHCPKCDQAHDIDDKYNYCPTCGQRIYWENEE